MSAAQVFTLPLTLDDRRLDELLSLWARWMGDASPLRELWYPDRAAGFVGGGYSLTFEDLIDAADARAAEAVNGAIDSLPPIQQCAVLHVHLRAVYRFRDLQATYRGAREALRVALPTRGVY